MVFNLNLNIGAIHDTGEAVLVQLWQSVSKSYRDDSDDAKKAWACLGRLQLRDVRDANVAAYVAQLRQLQAAKMVHTELFVTTVIITLTLTQP